VSLSAPAPAASSAPAPHRRLALPRRLRRGLRRLLLLAALLAAAASWAWLDRTLATPQRVERIAATGLPAAPSAWTRARAAVAGAPTVGLQVGHLGAREHPDELAALRVSTGGRAAGIDEVDVNLAVAEALAERLATAGVRVELLPATVPPGYRADLLLSIHADASAEPDRRGYKSAHAEPARNRREPWLRAAVDAAYLAASGLPHDEANVSGAMLDYYAFASDRLRHAAHPGTAGVIVELGYLSHPLDRAWLADPERPAAALAAGVLRYLAASDRWHPELAPEDAAATAPVLAWRTCVDSSSFCP
jgi:N-acetylmuramoyl-L-alanine amidase